jgi:2-haloacid dehalogenase
MRPAVLVFDVNETLLDLSPLRVHFEEIFDTPAPIGEWFARLLHGSLVANHLDAFRPFGVIGVEALLMVAKKRGISLDESTAAEVVTAMADLPAHPDVIPALDRLVDSGFRTVALTNGSTTAANAQIENAGLHPLIQRVISVEEVGRFKPDPLPYHHAAEVAEVEIGSTMLVAAHDWDVAGALSAGAQAAFVQRPGAVWSLPQAMPEVVASDIGGIADLLLK